MKNLYLATILFFITFISFAQAPELMSYQALVRNADGDLIQNTSVGLRISILQDSETGTAVYTETHTVTTNENGLVTLSIGSGTTSGDFSSIDWGSGTYYIKSETDPLGGTNYTIAGTSQLLSVPYALYAKSAEGTSNNPSGAQTISYNDVDGEGEISVVYTTTEARAFYRNNNGNGYWDMTPLNGNPIGAVATNDMVLIYTNTEARAFYRNGNGNGYWDMTPLNGTPIGAIAAKDIIVVYTTTEARAFYRNSNGNGYWDMTPLNGAPIGKVAANDIVAIYTNTEARAFYRNGNGNGYWDMTPLNSEPIGAGNTSESITIFSNTEARAFYRNSNGNGYWDITPINGTPIGIVGSN